MRWLKPVFAGDTIAYSARVLGTEEWRGRPEWGLLVMENEGRNQTGELVFSFTGRVLVERRNPLVA
jgi:acyl dehydratase